MDLKNNENPECVGPCSSGMTTTTTATATHLAATTSTTVPAPIRKRRFSSAKIQPTRVKRVMQSDDEIGRMVASVPVAIGRAMEHFAEKFLEAAAQCVQYSTSRTLSPSHMKQAVMNNPHFMFLEPLMREIPLPPSAGPDMQWRTDWVEQPSFSGFHPPGMVPTCQMSMPIPVQPQISLPKLPVGGNLLGAKRRQINGEVDNAETKPKRGRPRKVKKEDKCVDDDGLLLDEKPMMSYVKDRNTSPNGSMLTDRELMPPPSMLPIRALAAASLDNRRQSPNQLSAPPSTLYNNNGEQRQFPLEQQPNCMQSSSAAALLPASTTAAAALQTTVNSGSSTGANVEAPQ